MEVLGLSVAHSLVTHYCEDQRLHCGPLGPQVVAHKMTVAGAERWKAPERLSPLDTAGVGECFGVGLTCFEGILVWKVQICVKDHTDDL